MRERESWKHQRIEDEKRKWLGGLMERETRGAMIEMEIARDKQKPKKSLSAHLPLALSISVCSPKVKSEMPRILKQIQL